MNNMTKFKPINKYIVISKIDEQLKTDSGLLLSQEDAKSFRYMKALVISVGHEVHTVKDGESIYYDKSAGHTLLIGNDPFTVIREADVVVVLDAEVPD
jgi:co-chaperonin GroES (HSP10)